MDAKNLLRVGRSDLVTNVRDRLRESRFPAIVVRLGSKLITLTPNDLESDDEELTLEALLERFKLRKAAPNLWKIEQTSPPRTAKGIAGSVRDGSEVRTQPQRLKLSSPPVAKLKTEAPHPTHLKLGKQSKARAEVTSADAAARRRAPTSTAAWLGAELENHDARTSLTKSEKYVLAFMSRVGEQRKDDAAEVELDPAAAFGSVLTIQLVSTDFRVEPPSQLLHVDGDGVSMGRARFDVVPLKDGLGTLDVIVVKDGNFVHRFTLQARIGSAGDHTVLAIVASAGRRQITQEKLRRRDLLLIIDEEPGGFSMTAVKAVAVRGRLNMTAIDLATRAAEIRRTLLDIVNTVVQGRTPYQQDIQIDANVHAESTRKLAEQGYLLYQAIFFGPEADKQLNLIGNRLRELADTETLDIQIVSDRFLVPWPLLYVADHFDPDHIRPESFLAPATGSNRFRCRRLRLLDCEIRHGRDLAIGVNVNSEIDQQMRLPLVQEQLKFFGAVKGSGRATVTVRTRMLCYKAAFTNAATSDQLMYCYCHAGGTSQNAEMDFESGRSLKLRDLRLAVGSTRRRTRQTLSSSSTHVNRHSCHRCSTTASFRSCCRGAREG